MAHGQDIGFTIVSADGKTFATVGKRSGTIKVWSSATGSLLKKIQQVASPTENGKFYPLPKDSIYLYESTLYSAQKQKQILKSTPIKLTESRQTKNGIKGMKITVTNKNQTQEYFYEGMDYANVSVSEFGIGTFVLSKNGDSLYSYIIYPGKAPYLYGTETYKTQSLHGLFNTNFTTLLSTKGDFLYQLSTKKKIWNRSTSLFTAEEKILNADHMLDEKIYYAATATKIQVINEEDGKHLKTFTLDTFFYPRGFYLRKDPKPYKKFSNYRMTPLPDLSGYVYAPNTINWSGRDEAFETEVWLVKNNSLPIPLKDLNSKAEYEAQKVAINEYLKKDQDYLIGIDIFEKLISIRTLPNIKMLKTPMVHRAEADETKGIVYTFREPGEYVLSAYGPTLLEVLLYAEANKKWITQENLKWSDMQGEYSKWDYGCTNLIITSAPNVSIRFILIGRAPIEGAITIVKK